MCRTYRAIEVAPIVRIPSPDPFEACKALDAGAEGVIGPYIESVEQVKKLVGATKFRPLKGRKLEAFLECGGERDGDLVEYFSGFNENSVLIANIESRPAMDALDEIASVEGLDAVLIGPHDLSISLGIPEQYGHADFDAAVREIFQKARAHGIGAGIHWWFGADAQVAWAEAGANFIVNNSDVTAFEQRTSEEIAGIKKSLGDANPIGDGSSEVNLVGRFASIPDRNSSFYLFGHLAYHVLATLARFRQAISVCLPTLQIAQNDILSLEEAFADVGHFRSNLLGDGSDAVAITMKQVAGVYCNTADVEGDVNIHYRAVAVCADCSVREGRKS